MLASARITKPFAAVMRAMDGAGVLVGASVGTAVEVGVVEGKGVGVSDGAGSV